jgi:tetratricopeptide (TPR) repeat protein
MNSVSRKEEVMYREYFVVLIVWAVFWSGASARGQSSSALLEKGIYAEQTTGDLDGAIKIYKQIIDQEKADRPYVAQALYRLGECYLKKGQIKEATAAFDTVIRRFPGQKEWVAKAEKKLAEARANLSEAQVVKIVEEAVTTISTCVETDPRVAKAMESLQGLNENAVVKTLTKYLDSKEPTIRRSAIYILWKGEFESIEPAVPALMKLCANPEEFTRGMAALAIGAKKIEASYPTLCEMALNDKSGYARRCAAIALGWLGRPEAKDVLERVRKDSDPLVRENAEAALKLLSNAQASETSAPRVVRTTPVAFADDVSPALSKITVTFDRTMMDKSWSWTGGGETYPKVTGNISYDAGRRTCTLPVKLEPGKVYWVGINSPSHKNFQTPAHAPAARYVILFATKSAFGKPPPIPEDMARQAKEINAASEALKSKAPTAADKRAAEKPAAEAWKLWQQQKFAEAEKLFDQAVKKDPTNANAWNGLGWSQFNQGQPLNAQASFEKCLAINPKHAAALNGMGWIAKNAGQTEDAIGYWEKAIQAAPTATAALNGLATTYMEEKQYAKAVKYYEMWLKAEPNNADAKTGLGKAAAALAKEK